MTLIKREDLEEDFNERHDLDWTDDFDFTSRLWMKEKTKKETRWFWKKSCFKEAIFENEDLDWKEGFN